MNSQNLLIWSWLLDTGQQYHIANHSECIQWSKSIKTGELDDEKEDEKRSDVHDGLLSVKYGSWYCGLGLMVFWFAEKPLGYTFNRQLIWFAN